MRPLMVTCALALLLKLTILLQLVDHPLLHQDSGLDTSAYAELATRVVGGDLLLAPGVYFLSPLYIYFLAACLAIGDSFTAARVAQVVLGAVSVSVIWLMTAWWANRRAAWWAAGLALTTGVFTFYEILILQASLDTALTAMCLLALTAALRADRPWLFVLTGLLFGLAALNRPNVLLVIAGLSVIIALLRLRRQAVLVLAGAALACAPVAIRNGVAADEWLTVSSHGGLNLYIGNSPHATGFYTPIPGVSPSIAGQARDTRIVAGAALGRKVSDAEASGYFTSLALTWMREHPGRAVALFIRKFGFTFHATHIALPYSYPFYVYDTDAWLQWLPAGPWLLMPLGLVGLAVLWRTGTTRVRIWLMFVPLYAAAVAVFFVADRYRLPLLVPMCVGAGVALDALSTAIRHRSWRGLIVAGAATIVLAAAVNWPAAVSDGRWVEGLKLAQRYVILGDDGAARAWVERLAPTANPAGLAHHLVGRQYLTEGKPDRALPYLRDAVGLGLRNTQTLGDIVVAAERIGNHDEAREALQAIIPSADEDAAFWLTLGRAASSLQSPALAEPLFRQAVQQSPDDADARLQYGVNLVVLGRLADARVQLSEAVARNARLADALAYLAYCDASIGDIDAARRHADAALAIDATHPIARQVRDAIR